MPLITIGLPNYTGQEVVSQPGGSFGSAIVPAVYVLDGAGAPFLVNGNEGYIASNDGKIATLGSQADASWTGTGSGTLIAIAKALYSLLAGVLKTNSQGSGTLYASNPLLVPSTSGAAIPTNQACSWVMLVNDPTSTANLYYGISGQQPIPLAPGAKDGIAVGNTNLLWVKGAAGVFYEWIAGS